MPQDLWNENSEFWDNLMGERGDWFQQYVIQPTLIDVLGNISGKSILDAGCGNGQISRFLSLSNARVIGIDKSKKLIDKAKKYKHDKYSSISYIVCDLDNISITEQFDYIILNMVIQDLENYGLVINNLTKNLYTNSRLIITTRHPFSMVKKGYGWKMTYDGKEYYSGEGLSALSQDVRFCADIFVRDNYYEQFYFFKEWDENVTISFYRTLQDYCDTIYLSGLVIKRIIEPIPNNEGLDTWPDMGNLLLRIPHFIIFECSLDR